MGRLERDGSAVPTARRFGARPHLTRDQAPAGERFAGHTRPALAGEREHGGGLETGGVRPPAEGSQGEDEPGLPIVRAAVAAADEDPPAGLTALRAEREREG